MKRLIPAFLKRLDNYLLLNHPVVWISKIHIVLFYGIITWALSALSGILIPINLSQTQDLGLWYFLFTILAIIALCFWIYHNIIFNLEKKYGKRHWADEYKVLLLNMCCVFVFISFPIPFTSIYNTRVANTVSDDQFIKDINTLNSADAFLISNINNYTSDYDTIQNKTLYDLRQPQQFDPYTPSAIRYDTLKLADLASSYDISKIVKATRSDEQIRSLIKNYLDVRAKYDSYEYAAVDADVLLKRSKQLIDHSPMTDETFYQYYNTYTNDYYRLERILGNIAEAKYEPFFLWNVEFFNGILYVCLYMSLLVMLFKMVPWKQFLLTFISLIILPILLFIISQLLPYFSGLGRDTTYLTLMVLALLVAVFFAAISALPSKQFNPFKNICTQITYLAAPLLPVIGLLLVKTIFYNSYYDSGYRSGYEDQVAANTQVAIEAEMANPGTIVTSNTDNYYSTWQYIYSELERDYWYKWFDHWLYICVYGGLVLFAIVLMPVLKQLFVKQLALPHKS